MNSVRRAFISTLRPAAKRMAPFAAGRRGMAEAAGAIPQKLTLNLLAPHEAIFSNQGLCALPSSARSSQLRPSSRSGAFLTCQLLQAKA